MAKATAKKKPKTDLEKDLEEYKRLTAEAAECSATARQKKEEANVHKIRIEAALTKSKSGTIARGKRTAAWRYDKAKVPWKAKYEDVAGEEAVAEAMANRERIPRLVVT